MRRSGLQHLVVLGGFAFIVAACGTEQGQPDFDSPEPAQTPDVAADPGAVPPAAEDEQPVTAEIVELAGSGLGGEVRLEPVAGGTRVYVMLHGAEGVHQGHIHTGTCAEPGGVVAPLEPVAITADGHGEATSTVDAPFASLRDGAHIVVYHAAGGSPGAPAACAEIPAS